jgi:hypothetical protein
MNEDSPETLAEHFGLGKSQSELDFVDVPVDGDLPLFVDPFAISLRPDRWSQECARVIQFYFQQALERIKSGDEAGARRLLAFLGEPNETRLGLSRGRPQGAGIGRHQADQLYDALADSAAIQTGFINHLEETELMIPGIGRDKISDLTTNIIRKNLAEYTKQQCDLLDIPTKRAALPPYFDIDQNAWVSDYFDLPITPRGPLVLVPKVIVRYDFAYDHRQYYSRFVVEYLRAEELEASSSLVQVLKTGRRVVYKKDIEARYPLTKEFLYRFSRDRPEVLKAYREELEKLERSIDTPVVGADEGHIARMLAEALASIPPGGSTASAYHSLMVGILEFLFFPQLLHPLKEKEIHEGRKRIDILMENGARAGAALHALHDIKRFPCAYVPIECKNYTTEVANPELDQLAGRFSPNRGKFGLLCCRTFEDRDLFVERCRDTLRDDRGLIIPLDDATLRRFLDYAAQQKRGLIDAVLWELITEVWV